MKKKLIKNISSFQLTLIILMAISIIIFVLSPNMLKYDKDVKTELINKLKKENIHDLTIVKTNVRSQADKAFTEKDIEYIKDKISNNITENYQINEYNNLLSIQFEREKENPNIYYNYDINNSFQVVENWNNFKLIGNQPKKNNEVVISKYIADKIIKHGVILKPKNNNIDHFEVFKPKNYNEIISSNKQIYFNGGVADGTYIVVTGIVDEKISKYNILKKINISHSENRLLSEKISEFRYEIEYGNQNKIYVNKDFFENIEIDENNRLDLDFSYISHKINDKYITPQGFYAFPNNTVEYFNGKEIVKTDTLKDNEVIIHLPYLKAYTNKKSYDELKDYISTYCDDNLDFDKCIFEFITKNNIIGSNLDIKITDQRTSSSSLETKEYTNLKIIGYGVNNTTHEYYPKKILKQYTRDNKEIVSISIYEKDYKKIEKIINALEIESIYNDEKSNTKYQVLTLYNDYAINRKERMKHYSILLKIISTIIFSISLLLFIYLLKPKKK